MTHPAHETARAPAARAVLMVGAVETEYLRCGSGRPVLVLDPALAAAIAAGEVPAALADRRLIAPTRTTIDALAMPRRDGGASPFDAWLRGLIDGLGLRDLTVLVVPALADEVRRFAAVHPGEIAQVIATG